MLIRIIQISILLLISNTAGADAIRAYLGSDVARFSYATEAFGQQFGRLETEFGFLYTDRNERVRQDDYLAHIGLQVRGESLDAPLIASVGGRIYFGEASTHNISGIGLGGDVLLLPESWGGFGLGGFLYYAPNVVSFQDADSITEWGVFGSFQVTPQASIRAGVQNIEADIDGGGTAEITDEAFVGVEIRF